tara:strand:- start:2108 stop:2299 length:192 start_codon:yes stop_codon:yes gene_type:complete
MTKDKRRVKFVKPILDDGSPEIGLQFDVKKDVEDSKIIKPSDVFEGVSKTNNKRSKTKVRKQS